MIRDHLLISPNNPTHLVVRKANWVYIPAQLYNLSQDIMQTKNVYYKYPEVIKEMHALLENYRKKIESYPELG